MPLNLLFDLQEAQHEIVILLGQTGGGKSSIANVIMGKKLFAESCSIKSETDRLQIANGNFFGNGTPVSTIDTPGFLDSENRSANFMKDIIAIMKDFPKDKLKLVIITLPLSENRANSSYQTTIDEIELLLGPQFLDHTIFVTTCENQVKDPKLAEQRKNEWREWLTTHAYLDASKIRMCNFIYDDPSSLSMIEDAFKQFSTFNPTTSEKMDAYMKTNPHATVDEAIKNIEELFKIREGYEDRINDLIKDKEETIKKLQEQEVLSGRMQSRLDSVLKELEKKRKKEKGKKKASKMIEQIESNMHENIRHGIEMIRFVYEQQINELQEKNEILEQRLQEKDDTIKTLQTTLNDALEVIENLKFQL